MYTQALLFVILATAQAQLVSKGQCNYIRPVHQYETVPIVAAYEIRRIANTWNSGQCASWQMTPTENSIHVTRTEVADRKLIERNATSNINEDGSFLLTFKDFSSNFTILHGDKEYVVLYACSNEGENKQEYAWILSPNTNISESARKESLIVINNNKLSDASWMEISHTTKACENGSAKNAILAPIIVLMAGFVASKGL